MSWNPRWPLIFTWFWLHCHWNVHRFNFCLNILSKSQIGNIILKSQMATQIQDGHLLRKYLRLTKIHVLFFKSTFYDNPYPRYSIFFVQKCTFPVQNVRISRSSFIYKCTCIGQSETQISRNGANLEYVFGHISVTFCPILTMGFFSVSFNQFCRI